MKKKTNIPIEYNDPNNIFLKFTIVIIIACCICAGALFLYERTGISNETKIIKVKLATSNGLVDNCGHPMDYLNLAPHPILGETYEIIVTTNKDTEYITSIKPIEKEKYVENCSIFI
jgi:hypothetical protein